MRVFVSVGSAIWLTLGRAPDHLAYLLLQSRQVSLYHGPDFSQVDAEIVMNQDMPHGDDLWPRDLRVSFAKCGG